mgnify:FL=1
MSELFASPFFGIALSILAFWVGVRIQKKTVLVVCNPLLIGIVLVVGVLLLLRALLRQGRNAPKLLFQILIGTSLIVTFADYYAGWNGIAIDAIVPILCSVTLVLNFIFAFVNRRFTENGLVYLLLNIVVGVVPYIGLTLRHSVRPPMAWVICLVISMITFLGLVIFKGRSLLAEFEKRLHL